MDFMMDTLLDGRRIRVLTVVDILSRFSPIIEPDGTVNNFGMGREPMKMSGRVLAATLFAVAASGYAEIGSAGPHGVAGGFHGMSSGRFGSTGAGIARNAIIGTGSQQSAIIGTGSERSAIIGTGSERSAIIGTGSERSAIIGTGNERSAITGTGIQQKRDIR
jgi:hypothetical protein